MCPWGTLRSSISFKSAFDALDGDGDGRISPSDLRAFVDDDGVVESMIAAAGGGEKGFVELEEFERVVSGRGKKKKKEKVSVMEEVFGEMDVDKDGVVGFGDLKAYLRGVVGMDVADDEIREMIAIGRGDCVGGVCFDGLVRILTVGDGGGGGSKRC